MRSRPARSYKSEINELGSLVKSESMIVLIDTSPAFHSNCRRCVKYAYFRIHGKERKRDNRADHATSLTWARLQYRTFYFLVMSRHPFRKHARLDALWACGMTRSIWHCSKFAVKSSLITPEHKIAHELKIITFWKIEAKMTTTAFFS